MEIEEDIDALTTEIWEQTVCTCTEWRLVQYYLGFAQIDWFAGH